MRKLNEVFATNKESKTKLANDNFNIEHEFKQKLKELENESIKLENQISQLKEEKARKKDQLQSGSSDTNSNLGALI